MPSLRASFLVLLFALASPAAADPPSFDCASAKLPVEKAICRSAILSALDVEIAAAYGHVIGDLSGPRREAVRRAQRSFLAGRDEAFGLPDEDLEARLGEQITFLRSIETKERRTVAGSWRNGIGSVEVTERPDGVVEVSIATAEPARGRWLCDLSGEARQGPEGWVLDGDPSLLEGWRVGFVLRGGLLAVTARPHSETGDPPPFCGFGGTVEGDYLPVRPPSEAIQ